MPTVRYGGNVRHRAELYKACSRCGRNEHKVVVRYADNSLEGFCPSCYDDGLRAHLAEHGATLHADRRGRRPEWTPELKAEEAARLETISGIERLLAAGDIADEQMLAYQKRELRRLRARIVA